MLNKDSISVRTIGLLVTILLAVYRCAFPEDTRSTLHGLKAIEILVEEVPKIPDLRLTTEQIRTDVERRLRLLGIEVLEDSMKIPGNPILYVKLAVTQSYDAPLYAVASEVSLKQYIQVVRDPSLKAVMVPTWDTQSLSIIAGEANLQSVRETIGFNVDDFCKAYRSVNPR